MNQRLREDKRLWEDGGREGSLLRIPAERQSLAAALR
jgi:hypothetical protein